MFRLTIIAIIRKSLFTDVRSVEYVNKGNMYIIYSGGHYIVLIILYSLNYVWY
jgi:hypothetical protein